MNVGKGSIFHCRLFIKIFEANLFIFYGVAKVFEKLFIAFRCIFRQTKKFTERNTTANKVNCSSVNIDLKSNNLLKDLAKSYALTNKI